MKRDDCNNNASRCRGAMAKTKRVDSSDKVPELNKARQDKGLGWSVEKEGSCGSESERQQGVKAATFR